MRIGEGVEAVLWDQQRVDPFAAEEVGIPAPLAVLIDKANAVFGFGQWSWRVIDLVDLAHLTQNPNEAALEATVEVSVGARVTQVVASWSVVSDGPLGARKRCVREVQAAGLELGLRQYGPMFSEHLYDPLPAPRPHPPRERLLKGGTPSPPTIAEGPRRGAAGDLITEEVVEFRSTAALVDRLGDAARKHGLRPHDERMIHAYLLKKNGGASALLDIPSNRLLAWIEQFEHAGQTSIYERLPVWAAEALEGDELAAWIALTKAYHYGYSLLDVVRAVCRGLETPSHEDPNLAVAVEKLIEDASRFQTALADHGHGLEERHIRTGGERLVEAMNHLKSISDAAIEVVGRNLPVGSPWN